MKIAAERRVSRHIKHVVTEIIAPWGPGIEERPPVMSEEERNALWREKKAKKMERREARALEIDGESREVPGVLPSS